MKARLPARWRRRAAAVVLSGVAVLCAGLGAPAWAQHAGAAQAEAKVATQAQTTSPTPSFTLEVRAPQPLRALLERHLALGRYRAVPDLDAAELDRLMQLAEHDARALLGTAGYFSARVQVLRQPAAGGAPPVVVVQVDPAAQAVVRAVDIRFAGDIAAEDDPQARAQRAEVVEAWRLPVGQGFTQQGWDAAKSQALQTLVRRRHPGARIADSLAEVDAATQSVRLGLRIDSGALVRLGALQVDGLRRYDPRLVPRLSGLAPGQVYDQAQIEQARLRLTGSGYFDAAVIDVDTAADPAAAPVRVTLTEAVQQRVVLGLGVATDSGPRASIEHTYNRVPGLGVRAVSQLQLERHKPSIQSELTTIPGADGWRWSLLGRAERIDDGELITQGRQLRVGRLKADGHIDRNLFVQYDRARVRSTARTRVDPLDVGAGSALAFNYAWSGRYFDHPASPTRGFGVGMELGAGLTMGTRNQPFQRTVLRWLGLQPVASGRLQLRAEGGLVLARTAAPLPATQLFRTGGDASVRGYGLRDIGVPLPGGGVGPGRVLATGSIEWQQPLRLADGPSEIEGIVFIDAGAVADHVRQLEPSTGVGAGMRWRSPVGPLEVALAYGLVPKRLRLHLTVGFRF